MSDLRVLPLRDLVVVARQSDLRPLAETDADALAVLYMRSYPPDIGATDPDAARQEIAATFAGEYGDLRRDASLVAVDAGRVIGAVLVTVRSIWDDLDGPFVIDLFVDPDARRRGVGRDLVTAAAEACRDSGADTLSLRVGDGTSDAAHALYTRMGFVDPAP